MWLTFWCGSLFGAEAGLVAGLLMAASILLTAEATIATTDAVLLASVLGVQGVLLRVWRAAREDAPAAFHAHGDGGLGGAGGGDIGQISRSCRASAPATIVALIGLGLVGDQKDRRTLAG